MRGRDAAVSIGEGAPRCRINLLEKQSRENTINVKQGIPEPIDGHNKCKDPCSAVTDHIGGDRPHSVLYQHMKRSIVGTLLSMTRQGSLVVYTCTDDIN